jgi:hypothetical protein
MWRYVPNFVSELFHYDIQINPFSMLQFLKTNLSFFPYFVDPLFLFLRACDGHGGLWRISDCGT